MKHDDVLITKLNVRIEQNSLRKLEAPQGLIDFCSNDYLGFARSKELAKQIGELQLDNVVNLVGSGAPRLISGNNNFVELIEDNLASFCCSDTGLLFNSGYNSNIGFFSCVPQRGDVVFYDEYSHASIRDGLKMSLSKSYSFKHNDLGDLKRKLETVQPNQSVFVVVESVYSMDGDSPDLVGLANYCHEFGYHLVVDEAHGFGVFGPNGEGRIVELGLQDKTYARIITFGKALGCNGAVILGSETLRSYLVNYARSLIYTTMMSIGDQKAIYCGLKRLKHTGTTAKVSSLCALLKSLINTTNFKLIASDSCVQSLVIPGVDQVKEMESRLRKNGFWVKAILSPTVPEGMERIRICLHEFNSEEEIKELVKCMRDE
ncbi:MAG: pyridoxal phosphate-dependent aminotransferase family protein [Flavobacteriales bacterium]|nr:pyridoxal phosphate-dependent aminotransferase family protein [Flavobacteriales bacterium]